MLAFAVRRLLISIPILLLASFLVFALGASSGDPLAPLRRRTRRRPQCHRPRGARLIWTSRCPAVLVLAGPALFHGDFGPSVISTQDIGPSSAPGSG